MYDDARKYLISINIFTVAIERSNIGYSLKLHYNYRYFWLYVA